MPTNWLSKIAIDRSRFLVPVAFLVLAASTHAQPITRYVNNGRGDVPLFLPSDYDGTQELPLIVGLHGYNADPRLEQYLELLTQIDAKQFMYLLPLGTVDLFGNHFWDATDACCGTGTVDDSSYLRGLVDLVGTQYSVDSQSIHFAGVSNGGFMAHRMAIDHAEIVASFASLAGANFLDADSYNPVDSVHMLQIHGTEDTVALYHGGMTPWGTYPGAEETALNWASYNGIPTSNTAVRQFDLDLDVQGDETTSLVYGFENNQGVTVELWRMDGSGHVPSIGNGAANQLAPRLVDWLLRHEKMPLCDFDASGTCNSDDLDALTTEIALGGNNPGFDLNNDSTVNLMDRDVWLSQAGNRNLGAGRSYSLGDANLDGVVDVSDFGLWNASKFQSTSLWTSGDFNADGSVDVGDFNLWNANKFTAADAVTVPEPDGLSIGIVLIGIILVVRRMSRSR